MMKDFRLIAALPPAPDHTPLTQEEIEAFLSALHGDVLEATAAAVCAMALASIPSVPAPPKRNRYEIASLDGRNPYEVLNAFQDGYDYKGFFTIGGVTYTQGFFIFERLDWNKPDVQGEEK